MPDSGNSTYLKRSYGLEEIILVVHEKPHRIPLCSRSTRLTSTRSHTTTSMTKIGTISGKRMGRIYLVYGFLLPENNRQGILSTSVSEKVRMTLNSKYIETIVRGVVSESEEYTPVLCLFTNHGYPKFTNDQLEEVHGIVKDALELPDDAVAKWYYDDEHHGPE